MDLAYSLMGGTFVIGITLWYFARQCPEIRIVARIASTRLTPKPDSTAGKNETVRTRFAELWREHRALESYHKYPNVVVRMKEWQQR